MNEPRCECCDLPVSSCGKAAEHRQRVALARWRSQLRERGWFESAWPGVCPCGEPFKEKALISRDQASGRWIAECCAPGADR